MGRSAATAARMAPAVEVPPAEFDEADAPPPDEEPPFHPGPEPVIDAVPVAEAAPSHTAAPATTESPAKTRNSSTTRSSAAAPATTPNFAAAAAATEGGIQRYGEAVVREVLGATFLEEVEAPPRPGFGERG